jgi:two-component system chemotaxis sensor kinase CheA
VTSSTDLKEFLTAYLVEAEEHVSLANQRLLALEAAQRRGGHDARGLREIFRSLHTIKGLSAMVGVEPVVAIAHRLEAFVRGYDRLGTAPPLHSTDVLLKGVQAIAQRLAALGRGEAASPPPPELLAELDRLDSTDAALVEHAAPELDLDPELAAKLAPFELEQLVRGLAAGQRGVVAEFFPSPERAAQGLSINSVRERLSECAEIVRVVPRSLPVSPESPGGLSFRLVLLTSEPDERIAAAVGVTPAALQAFGGAPALPASEPFGGVEPSVTDEEAGDGLAAGVRRGIVRVDVNRLDDAMEELATLIVTRYRLARAVAALTARGVNTRELSDVVADNARQLRSLRAAIVRVRMVSISDLLDRVPLLVRGLQRATNRRVRVELDGTDAELDKSVSERLFPVIVHLVRNAVDHAIETPDERVRRNKPEEGLLRIACRAHSNTRLELTVSDDGRGIDRQAVARKAAQPVPESAAALLELLCRPGLSTRDVATTTSGRGMGMEIVKRVVIDELGGELEVATELGVGTTFTLRVPLTIAIVDAFAFECAGQRFVVPVSTVDEIVEVGSSESVPVPAPADDQPNVDVILRRGHAVPIVSLASVFRMAHEASPGGKAIIVRRAGMPIAFAVDRMLGQQEVVIRPMNDALVRVPGVSGATDLGDGRATLVLDLVALGTSLSAGASWRSARS